MPLRSRPDDELERRLEAMEDRFRLAYTGLSEQVQRLAREAAGDERGEKKEPYLPYLIDLCGLKAGHAVLDVGCGRGLLAAELAGYLGSSGSYDGMDVREKHIHRLRRSYARVPNFNFHLVDVANATYNRDGGTPAERYAFPFADASFHLVVLRSVFTHMFPAEVTNYVGEIARVLQPGGRCFITYYLLNDETDAAGEFPHDRGDHRVKVADHPLRAIALPEEFVRSVYARHGLEIAEPIHFGSWAGREGTLVRQDVVVARRARAPRPRP